MPEKTKMYAAGEALKPILQWLDKSTCVVVGPGLGSDPVMCETATRALREARQRVRAISIWQLKHQCCPQACVTMPVQARGC